MSALPSTVQRIMDAEAAKPPRILVIDDVPTLSLMLEQYLSRQGFEVRSVPDGERGIAAVREQKPDAVVLDIGLPGMDGFEVCRRLRPAYRGVIIMLTARDSDVDHVVGLELGADDYLPKPVNLRLVEAHLRAHLRRKAGMGEQEGADSEIRHGVFSINRATREVRIGENVVSLTDTEFSLLWLLAENAGSILSRNDILRSLRGISYDGTDRSIDMRISRLRRRLGDDASQPTRIKSVRGRGYLFSKSAWH